MPAPAPTVAASGGGPVLSRPSVRAPSPCRQQAWVARQPGQRHAVGLPTRKTHASAWSRPGRPSSVVIAPTTPPSSSQTARGNGGARARLDTATRPWTPVGGRHPSRGPRSADRRGLFVAEMAETASRSSTNACRRRGGKRPTARLLVNNDGDGETATGPDGPSIGEPSRAARRATDGRIGYIRRFSLATWPTSATSRCIPRQGFPRGGARQPTIQTAPTSLRARRFGNRLFITRSAASPEERSLDNNVFPVVYVADLSPARR